jgi:hypothetical protein
MPYKAPRVRVPPARRIRRFLCDRTGVAAVEAALLMPVFLLFIFGTIEFGRAAYTKAVITFAVQEVSRYAMVATESNLSTLKDKIAAKLIGLNPDKIEDLTVSETTNADLTRTVTMTLNYRFEFLVPMLHMTDMTLTADQVFLRE